MRVWAVGNAKGGTGKSVTAVAIADAMARKRKRVLLVDFDPQGSASVWLGHPNDGSALVAALKSKSLAGCIVTAGRFDLAPSGVLLATDGAAYLGGRPIPSVLRDALKELDYDAVLIDCPPSLGPLVYNALAASEGVVIPCECSVLALAGLAQYGEVLDAMRDLSPDLSVSAVIPVKWNRTKHSAEAVEILRGAYGKLVTEPVPETVTIRDAAGSGLVPHDYAPARRVSAVYDGIAAALLKVKR